MRDLLRSASDVYKTADARILLVGHCLLVSSWFRDPWRNRFLLCYWIGLTAAFGGGIASSILLQKPDKAAIAVFSDNYLGLIWTICWWLITYCPGDVGYRIFSLPPFRIAAKVCLNILRAGLIAGRVDVTQELYPGGVLAALVIGTIAGSGGKLISDGVALASGHLKGPAEVTQPGFSVWSGFLGALIYYLTSHVLEMLTRDEAKALVTTLFVAHGLLADISGYSWDYTYPIARLIHSATFIPMPGLQQARPDSKQTAAVRRPPSAGKGGTEPKKSK